MNYKSEIENLITNTSAVTNTPLMLNQDIYIVYQPQKHTPLPLPKGKMAVYTFVYNGIFLKIGQANKKSKARYQSHHYYIKSGKSTLANSLMKSNLISTPINTTNVTQWIKDNCERYDIIIDEKFGKYTLNFIEGLLHHQYKPKYEG